mgnify:CR=1 FL=1
MRRIFFLLFLLVSGMPVDAQEAVSPPLPVQSHTLTNGLRLLILPRHAAPTVAFVVQYRIGSVNEEPGETGLAHLLEHLLFKGTTTVGTLNYQAEAPILDEMDRVQETLAKVRRGGDTPDDSTRIRMLEGRLEILQEQASALTEPNEFDVILSRNGARGLNASTTSEATTYYVELPANRTELWFVMEGDRMRNPVFREFYTERDVVAEERRLRLETNPGGLLYEAHIGEAFRVHPYGRPVIGTMEDLENLSRRDVREYFRTYYGPNNAVVAIVGDVDPQQTLRWARRYLGTVPRGNSPPPVDVEEPPQEGERRVRVAFEAEPGLRIGWRVPSAFHPDAPALAMLASILTGGRSSRLYQRLVIQDRLATGVTSGTGPGYLFPRLFSIDASPRFPHSPAAVETAIYQELDRLRDVPPEEVEVQRVRNQLEASAVRRLRSNFGLAIQLAESESLFGDWRHTFEFFRSMESVTPRDIQRVVREYFTPDQRTVAVLARVEEVVEGGLE